MKRAGVGAQRRAKSVAFDPGVSRYGFCNALRFVRERTAISHGEDSGQLVEMAQPTARAPTSSDALRFSEAAGLEFAAAHELGTVRGQMLAPRLQRPRPFKCGASHILSG
jgi:hypothetical protein